VLKNRISEADDFLICVTICNYSHGASPYFIQLHISVGAEVSSQCQDIRAKITFADKANIPLC
jgi:hypothetical protein